MSGRRLGGAGIDMGHHREGRVHQDDARAKARVEVIFNLCGVKASDRAAREQQAQKVGTSVGQLVQRKAAACDLRKDRQKPGPGRWLEDQIAGRDLCRRQGHPLTVVPAGGGDHPSFLLGLREAGHLEQGPANLEGAAELLVFPLHEDGGAQAFAQGGGVLQGGVAHPGAQKPVRQQGVREGRVDGKVGHGVFLLSVRSPRGTDPHSIIGESS